MADIDLGQNENADVVEGPQYAGTSRRRALTAIG
jgi:hypothetical protein